MQLKILHLDDNAYELTEFANQLLRPFDACSFAVESVLNFSEFENALKAFEPDLIILDVELEATPTNRSGVDICRDTRRKYPHAPILMRSRHESPKVIRECIEAGAADYILKSSESEMVQLRLLQTYNLLGPNTHLNKSLTTKIAGETMRSVAQRVPRIADSDIRSIHCFGETGTGKEVVADLFRAYMGAGKPFVVVNCGSLSPTLMESQLFGYVKGAFTGATTDRRGFFEAAHRGFIYLDEVALLTDKAQQGLLRVIENQEVTRLGANEVIKLDVRVISATNEDLTTLVKSGKFRGDLQQRLKETTIVLPPLRDRKNEINELIDHFLGSFAKGPYSITPAVRLLLNNFDWREGNVRQLRSCLRAMTEYKVGSELSILGVPKVLFENAKSDPNNAEASLLPDEFEFPLIFENLSDELLVRVINSLYKQKGILSLRKISEECHYPRTTLANKLKQLSDKSPDMKAELAKWVKLK